MQVQVKKTAGRAFHGSTVDKRNKLARTYLSNRAKQMLFEPQHPLNCFSYRVAISMLGLKEEEVYLEGRSDLRPEYFDFAWMANHIGPSEFVLRKLKESVVFSNVEPYPTDLLMELREIAAKEKFGRERGSDFEVVGVEGAQGGIGFTMLAYLNEGDEVLVPDPSYFHFATVPIVAGAKVKRVPVTKENNYRWDPEELKENITLKTKMVIVCDPLNPFGTVQTRDELIEIANICREYNILVFNNITHCTYQIDENIQHYPMASLHHECNMDHVISTCGTSKAYGLSGLRVGFLAGHPDLLRAPSMIKSEVTKTGVNWLGQYAALAAMHDSDYVKNATRILKRNFEHLRETVRRTKGLAMPIEPAYGFSTIVDVSGTGVTAQEICVGLFKHKIAAMPGDGLGNVGALTYLRLNYSSPDLHALEALREALPAAIEEAKMGHYRQGVIKFFKNVGTERGQSLSKEIEKMYNQASIPQQVDLASGSTR